VNGKNNNWTNKIEIGELKISIDKSTDFMFFNASTNRFELNDITGYPKTIVEPFKTSKPYPILTSKDKRQQTKSVV